MIALASPEELNLIIAVIGAVGAGVSVYVFLRIGLSETKKDITSVKDTIEKIEKRMDATDAKTESLGRDMATHTHMDHHVSRAEVAEIKHTLTDFIKTNDATHERIIEKIDKLAERK